MRALLFPGQGTIERALLEVQSEEKEKILLDLEVLFGESPAEAHLTRHEHHSALVVADAIATFEAYRRQNGKCEFVCGYSVGHFAALAAAEVLSPEDAIRLAFERGILMKKHCPPHCGMLNVIGLEQATVEQLIADAQKQDAVSFATLNSRFNLTLGGRLQDLTELGQSFQAAGSKSVTFLPVEGAWHSPLLSPALSEFKALIETFSFHKAKIPVALNSDASTTFEPETLKLELLTQLTNPVMWQRCIEELERCGVDHFIECGAGQQLKKMLFFLRVPRCSSIHALEEVKQCAA